MNPRADRVVLVVEDDRIQLEALKILLTNPTRWRVEGVPGAREAIERLAHGPIDAMVLDQEMPGLDGLTYLSNLRADPATARLPILILTASTEADVWRRAWGLGADGVLQKPTHPSVLRAALEACLQRRERAADEAEQLRVAQQSVTALVDLLRHQLETIEPGAHRRSSALIQLAEVVADMHQVEEDHLPDLRHAARLWGIARIGAGPTPTDPGERRSWLNARETAASAALLRTIPALESVAAIVEGMGANWDGSGIPAELQRGQIPVRSRILRAAVDLQSLVSPPDGAPGVSMERALAALDVHNGSWYDPATMAILHRLTLGADGPVWDPDVELCAVDDLRVGMELAADLETASGVKLLSKGARISAPNLDLVRRRHERDPIPHGVPVRHRKD